MTQFWLLDPWMLLWGLLIPLGLVVRRIHGQPRITFSPAFFLVGLPRSWRIWLYSLAGILPLVGFSLLVFALARPVARHPLPLTSAGMDIMLCLDTSSSMAAKDMDPAATRLGLAKAAARTFVAGRGSDRIGLLRFAMYPDLVCPLTRDHKALDTVISMVEQVRRDGPEDRTGIGTVVARAAEVLARGEATSRVVILFTDGRENVATAQTPDEIGPLQAGKLCAALGVKVYVIAAGGSESKALDTTQIEEVARISSGRFYRARDASAVERMYSRIDELEKTVVEEPRWRVEEKFHLFLIIALGLFLGRWILAVTILEVLP